MTNRRPLSSRERYRAFVEDYRQRRLDDSTESGTPPRDDKSAAGEAAATKKRKPAAERRKYIRDYLRWLRPHRWAVALVFLLALVAGALQMVEPLFMRFIIDHVLLNKALDAVGRLARLHVAGVTFLVVILVSNSFGALKDYRQRLLNVTVMRAGSSRACRATLIPPRAYSRWRLYRRRCLSFASSSPWRY
jgi:ATP-binding cassette subfamily B protein